MSTHLDPSDEALLRFLNADIEGTIQEYKDDLLTAILGDRFVFVHIEGNEPEDQFFACLDATAEKLPDAWHIQGSPLSIGTLTYLQRKVRYSFSQVVKAEGEITWEVVGFLNDLLKQCALEFDFTRGRYWPTPILYEGKPTPAHDLSIQIAPALIHFLSRHAHALKRCALEPCSRFFVRFVVAGHARGNRK